MIKKSLKLRLAHFFLQHLPDGDSSGSLPEFVRSASEWERTKGVMEDILRWEDDGGHMLYLDTPLYLSNVSNTPAQSDNHGS
jgi:hypothetical protein